MTQENPLYDDVIPVNAETTLEAVDERHVAELYQLILRNKDGLQQSLNWVQSVVSEADTLQSAQGNRILHQRGYAKMFVIVHQKRLTGVLSFNQIEPLNKTGYIGYWLDEACQGKGLLSACLQTFIHFYASRGVVRRFVIKCRVDNVRSNRVAQRNGFTLEGCLKQAEYLNGRYDDQNIYARILDIPSE